jgi:hypothetical protein
VVPARALALRACPELIESTPGRVIFGFTAALPPLRAAIAQSQKARSFELRAALSLAKLYRAADRDADAHAVRAPAVEGFPPTQQFPELTEAQTLLAALSR